jgi:flagellar basal-body rod protein FlgG
VKAGSVYRITTQGAMTRTDNQFDIAIEGRGFFQVLMPSGETSYTRAGNLSVSDQGALVTEDGYAIQPGITIPGDATKVTISKSGQVEVQQAGQTSPSVVGQLELATFVNEAGLSAIGDNLYMETGASGAATTGTPGTDGIGNLLQGYTEASNVDAVSEITALIVAQRAYEMNSKVITSADEMLRTASQVKS